MNQIPSFCRQLRCNLRWRHGPIAAANRLHCFVCHLCLWLELGAWCWWLVHMHTQTTDDWRSVSHRRALASYGFWSRRVAAGVVLVFGAERSAGQGRRPAVDRRLRPLVWAPPFGRLGQPQLAPLDDRPRPPVSVPTNPLLSAEPRGRSPQWTPPSHVIAKKSIILC